MKEAIKMYRDMRNAKKGALSHGPEYWTPASQQMYRHCKRNMVSQVAFWLVAIGVVVLILVFAFAASAQGLIDADGVRWNHVAVGKPVAGKKFDIYVELPGGGSKAYPELIVKTLGGPRNTVSLDCKQQLFKAGDEEWIKAPDGSLGKALLKFACKK